MEEIKDASGRAVTVTESKEGCTYEGSGLTVQLPARDDDKALQQFNAQWDDALTAQPAPAPVIPVSVSMRQARLALLGAGLLPQVDAAIAGLPSPQKEAAQIEWEYSQEVHRDKALVQALTPMLGLDDATLDSLFLTASKL